MFSVKKYETIHLRSFYLPSYFVANRAPEIPNCDKKTYMFGYKGQFQYLLSFYSRLFVLTGQFINVYGEKDQNILFCGHFTTWILLLGSHRFQMMTKRPMILLAINIIYMYWFNSNVWIQYSPILNIFIRFYTYKIVQSSVSSVNLLLLSYCDFPVGCQIMEVARKIL